MLRSRCGNPANVSRRRVDDRAVGADIWVSMGEGRMVSIRWDFPAAVILNDGDASMARAQKLRGVADDWRISGELRQVHAVLVVELEYGIHGFGFNFCIGFSTLFDDSLQAHPSDAPLIELSEAARVNFFVYGRKWRPSQRWRLREVMMMMMWAMVGRRGREFG